MSDNIVKHVEYDENGKEYVDIWKIETRDECIERVQKDCEKLLSGDAGDAPVAHIKNLSKILATDIYDKRLLKHHMINKHQKLQMQ